VFSISVDDPQRVGDPIRAYTMYTVHTRVSATENHELLAEVASDNLADVQQIRIFRAPPILRFPLAL
jgi:hypothetical protein